MTPSNPLAPSPAAARAAWLRSLVPYAQAAKARWPGMRVSVCLAQAALETGWGKRPIGGFNLWGIKDVAWDPGCVEVGTHEVEAGAPVAQRARFEDARTPQEGFNLYGRLVTNGKPYQAAHVCSDLEAYVRVLARSWATDPDYAGKILRIIAEHELAQYDLPAPAEASSTYQF